MKEQLENQIEELDKGIEIYRTELRSIEQALSQIELEARERIADLMQAAEGLKSKGREYRAYLEEHITRKIQLGGVLDFYNKGQIVFSGEASNTEEEAGGVPAGGDSTSDDTE